MLTDSQNLHDEQARSFTDTTLAKIGRQLDDLAATLSGGNPPHPRGTHHRDRQDAHHRVRPVNQGDQPPSDADHPDPTAMTVHFATADGTAKAGSNYTATSGNLTFLAGQTNRLVPVTIKGDATKESAESFSLKLSSASSGHTFKDAGGPGTITNDD